MADQPKRRVTAQITHSASTPTSSSSAHPRARAKVDPSSISTPPTRPTLRSTPSSTSLVSRTSAAAAGPSTRPFSPSFNSRSTPGTPGTPGTPTLRPGLNHASSSKAISTAAGPATGGPRSTPVIRARTTPIPTVKPSTPSPASVPKVPNVRPGLRPSSSVGGASSTERGRARVNLSTGDVLDTPIQIRARSRSPLPSPSLASSSMPPPPHSAPIRPPSQDHSSSSASTYGQPLTRVTSHHSSPGKKASALPAYLRPTTQHPTASAPPSPPIGTSADRPMPAHSNSAQMPHAARMLPISPNNPLNGLYANLPTSPELKTVGLPVMTPRRGSEASETPVAMSRNTSLGPGLGIGLGLDGAALEGQYGEDVEDRDRWSGSTAVASSLGKAIDQLDDKLHEVRLQDGLAADRGVAESGGTTPQRRVDVDEEDQVEDDLFEEDAEEAKVNRKVADLEISNASLMAINRSLEATKAKQRAEIIKLRRALRESRDGPSFHLSSRPITSPGLVQSPTEEDFGDRLDGYTSEEMDDPELEERWEKIQEMVVNMQRRGEGAVQRVMQEEKVLTRVIDMNWGEAEEGSARGEREDTPGGTPGRGSPAVAD